MEEKTWQVLIDNGLRSYIMVLEDNNIDEEILSELTETDYVKLGITSDDRRKMIRLFSNEAFIEEKQVAGAQKLSVVTALETKPVIKEVSPVHKILIDNDLSEYIAIFDKHNLTSFNIISKLSESDLSEIGVTSIGDRKKIKDIFNIKDENSGDSNVVVTQTVNAGGAGSTIIGVVIGGLIVFGIIMWYMSYLVSNS
jgi:hypothetical protein